MDVYKLSKSNRKDKKFVVITPDGKKVHFGARGYSDFPLHKSLERKKRYDERHKKRENWQDLNTAGAWAKWILWNLPDLYDSIKDMEKRFKIKIKIGSKKGGSKNVKDKDLWRFAKLLALQQYAKDGRWNARVAQQAVRIYKDMGGKYKKGKKDLSLERWTEEQWMHHPSNPEMDGRYLPKKVWDQLTENQIDYTNMRKREGTKKGMKYVPWEDFVIEAYNKMYD